MRFCLCCPNGHPHIAQVRPPPEGPGLPWVARRKTLLAQKGQPKFARREEDKAGGTPALRNRAPQVFFIPQTWRLPCLWAPVPISAAPLGHDPFVPLTQGRPGPSGGGLAWAIFGNAFSVEEVGQRQLPDSIQKASTDSSAIALEKA